MDKQVNQWVREMTEKSSRAILKAKTSKKGHPVFRTIAMALATAIGGGASTQGSSPWDGNEEK